MEKKSALVVYMRVIKDLYNGVMTRVRTLVGDTNDFSIDIGLHQPSALSPFLFTIAVDKLTRRIQDEILVYVIF